MAEFDIQDWSLQAIVRGSSGDFSKIVHTDMDVEELDREFLDSLPEILGLTSSNFIDELEELYKPFYRVVPPSPPATTTIEFQGRRAEDKYEQTNDQTHDVASDTSCVAKDHLAAYNPKYKRRKNQQKRVVTQVSAESLASDMWAWRKYGQKPIKGSPYPRSYYRCSSSKSCLARKQVEQSYMDPGKFIITYTAEHNHNQPTRRNSLAGTIRQKFPSPKSPISTKSTHVKQEKIEEYSDISADSPKTPNQMDCHQEKFKQEKKDDVEHGKLGHDDTNEFLMSDLIFDGDFFSGLEDFDEFDIESELPINHTSASQQLPVRSCS